MATDFEAEGLLEGLDDAAAREARLDLLRQLEAEGVPLEELRRAVVEDRLALLPLERVLEGDDQRYTLPEVAEHAGVELDFVRRALQALGLPRPEPEEVAFGEADVEMAHKLATFRQAGLSDDRILEVSRVLGLAMAQVAAAVRRVSGEAFLRPGDTERDLGLRFAEVARSLVPEMGPLLEHLFRLHQREQVRRDVLRRAEITAGRLPGASEITVSFADLVGWTKLGEQLPADEMGAVAGRLSELAADVASPPVRLVKMIGDAAMLVSEETGPLLDAALGLVESVEAEGESFPQLRAGVARGEALARGGDWYGRPVNLASRVTSIARPGSVLTTQEVRDEAEDDYRWSNAGRRQVKGIKGDVELHRVRVAEPDDDAD